MSKETEDRLAKFEIEHKEIQEELRSKLAQIEANITNSHIDLLNNMKEMIEKHQTAGKSLVENPTNSLHVTPVHIPEFTSVPQEIQSPIYFAVKNSPYQAGASFPTDCPTTSELKPDEFCISNEVLDLNKSVEKEKFTQRLENIEEVIKSIETVESFYGFDAKELSLDPGLVIPPKFKVPDFKKYNGTTCPLYHITMYCRRMTGYVENEKLLIHCFQDSLLRSASRLYNKLKRTQIRSWRDLAQAFLGQYKHMTDMAPDQTMLQSMNMKCNESFRQYSQRWKDVASQVHPPLTEKEFTTLFISTLKFPYVNHMIGVVPNNFSDIIISGEIIEMAIKNGKIRGSDNTKVKKEAGVNTARSYSVKHGAKPYRVIKKKKNVQGFQFSPFHCSSEKLHPKMLSARSITPQLDQSQWPPNENWTYKEVPWINQTGIPNCSAKVPGNLKGNFQDPLEQAIQKCKIKEGVKVQCSETVVATKTNVTKSYEEYRAQENGKRNQKAPMDVIRDWSIAEMSIQNPLDNMRAFIRSERSKKVIASRARKTLKVFQESISDLYPHLVKGQYITPRLGSSICKHAAYPDLDASTSFFGVYDGHGGKVVAKICAKYLHQQVLKNEVFAAGDIGTSVQRAFLRMDEVMYGQIGWRELAILGDKFNKFTGMIEGLIWSPRSGNSSDQVDNWAFKEGPHSDFSGPTSGCTACVAVLRNKQLVVANAGDSLCVISRNGQAYNLSRDHKPDLEVEKERILKAGGFIHGGRVNVCLNLARAIGDIEFKQNKFLPAEKQIVTANPDVELCDDDDFLVLACDGIWDCMSSQKLVDFIHEQLHSESKLSTVCERVLDKCLAPSTATGEGCDNMTMVLVQFKKPIKSVSSSMDDSKSFDTESKQEGNQE
ncbi:putative protein phosphatase 2C 70 [Hibiscus syriacus]|uniref:protein-serine/threonine phosphatase n=1 Tax=Hibiscus syriacus TaxID=106335 RepID=A0A6A3CU47_HIBSY|nr:putative protein phosphatase 2C 70 [Hibiscus syriacus]